MWLGVVFLAKGDGEDVEQDTAIVVAYERERLFTVGGPTTMVSQIVVLLGQAAREGDGLCLPRCGECGEPLEVPPLDEWAAACASA